jgi:hypothetical protein
VYCWTVCRCRHPRSSIVCEHLRGSKVMRQSGVDTLISEEPDDRVTWQCLPTVKELRKRRSFPE